MEEFPPSGHELGLPEEPEHDQDDEQGQDADLVEVHGPEICILLQQNLPDMVVHIVAGTLAISSVGSRPGSGIFLPETVDNFPDRNSDVK